jgi:hypothetical protein
MSGGLVEILPFAAGEIFFGKNHTVLNETAPSPGITGKQTFLLKQCSRPATLQQPDSYI